MVLRKLLWKNGILLAAEDVGGSFSRTMWLETATGRTRLKRQGSIIDLHPGSPSGHRSALERRSVMPHTVLVVDDSDVTRAMIIKTLDLARVPVSECLEAANGKEALELLENNWVDIVFADLNMPVMGGREMLRLMRTTPEFADIPVIVISSEHCDPGLASALVGLGLRAQALHARGDPRRRSRG